MGEQKSTNVVVGIIVGVGGLLLVLVLVAVLGLVAFGRSSDAVLVDEGDAPMIELEPPVSQP